MKYNRVGFKRCDGCLLLQEGPGWGRPKGGDCIWQLEGHCWILGFSGRALLLSIYLPWSTGASGGRHCTWDTEMKDLTISIPSKHAVQKGGQHVKSWLWNVKLVAFSVCMCVAGGVMDEAYGGKQAGHVNLPGTEGKRVSLKRPHAHWGSEDVEEFARRGFS